MAREKEDDLVSAAMRRQQTVGDMGMNADEYADAKTSASPSKWN